ncbi:hypothetical protein BWO94_07910, partial [Staphylococcus aureus]
MIFSQNLFRRPT